MKLLFKRQKCDVHVKNASEKLWGKTEEISQMLEHLKTKKQA